jgi:hypothetical protein
MKNLFISLAAASVLLFIGCQENSIVDPVTNEPTEKVQAGTPDNYFHGIIPLESVLNDPYPIGNSFYRIIGQIEYNFSKIYMDPKLPAAQQHISLHLEINADLQYFCTVCPPTPEDDLFGFISEISDSYVPIAGNTVSFLEKTFAIQGREDKMVLKARFSVSNDRIELSAMWLAFPNTKVIATDIINY